tara:strand:+ start:271 stop:654 length:384 start_codon:yes stop_codon:yes gene_type:complete
MLSLEETIKKLTLKRMDLLSIPLKEIPYSQLKVGDILVFNNLPRIRTLAYITDYVVWPPTEQSITYQIWIIQGFETVGIIEATLNNPHHEDDYDRLVSVGWQYLGDSNRIRQPQFMNWTENPLEGNS